jgi:hypothetical protein
MTASSGRSSIFPAVVACSGDIWCWPSSAEVVHGTLLPHASARDAHVIPFFMRLKTTSSVTSLRVMGELDATVRTGRGRSKGHPRGRGVATPGGAPRDDPGPERDAGREREG